MKNLIKNQTFPNERALYGLSNYEIHNCSFKGIEDGESALKECKNIDIYNTVFELRYPLWHDTNLILSKIIMTETCRAALWYCDHVSISSSSLGGIKALRECSDINISGTNIKSAEFGWRCNDINISNTLLEGEYVFLMSNRLKISGFTLKGKYSFQYVNNMEIDFSFLDTKDAFWHTKNVTVKNSTIKGEYLAWYSDGLTLINCTIIGTQPLCYCKNLKLINCKMINTDLCFEYSDVEATIDGDIDSVKNPKSGFIKAHKIKEILLTEDSKYVSSCEIIEEK